MKHKIKMPRIALMIISIVLSLFLLASCIGDPGVYIQVDNRTDQTLGIFIDKLHSVDVPSGKLSRFGTTSIYPENVYPADKEFLIEAKIKQEEVVYSENFTWQQLNDMDWTIVILPPQKHVGTSDNATAK